MNILWHIVLSFVLGIVIFRDPILVAAFFAGGVLIDFDHVLFACYKNKSIRPKVISNWLNEEYKIHRPHLYLFHTFEFIFTCIIIAVVIDNPVFSAIVLGIIFHEMLDIFSYIAIYRSTEPWMRSMIMVSYM